MFATVTSAMAAPVVNAAIEDLWSEFKSAMTPVIEERAKDIAALANALGGVIWVGVIEDKVRKVVSGYKPVTTRAAADAIRVAYQEAADKNCSPRPIIDTVLIPIEGGFVVAINVFPFPGQAIGVLVDKDTPTYRFPIRLGSQTAYLKAEQLPMLMVPEVRRVASILHRIPAGARIRLGGRDHAFVEVQELENVVVLRRGAAESGKDVRIALDQITSVWKGDDDVWQLRSRVDMREQRLHELADEVSAVVHRAREAWTDAKQRWGLEHVIQQQLPPIDEGYRSVVLVNEEVQRLTARVVGLSDRQCSSALERIGLWFTGFVSSLHVERSLRRSKAEEHTIEHLVGQLRRASGLHDIDAADRYLLGLCDVTAEWCEYHLGKSDELLSGEEVVRRTGELVDQLQASKRSPETVAHDSPGA